MKLAKKITLIVFVLAIIGAVVVYLQYRQILDYAKKPINIVQETIFTVPAGTGRVALEGLLIKEKFIEEGHHFQLLSSFSASAQSAPRIGAVQSRDLPATAKHDGRAIISADLKW